MSVLNQLIKNNEYPIIFLGSGISKRYLKKFPAWEDLLEEYWEQIGEQTPFYSYLISFSKEIKATHPDYNESQIEFLTNIKVAKYVETKFNELYLEGKIKISNLDFKSYYRNNLSAFKQAIAVRFGDYEIKKDMESELVLFKSLLRKAQIIVTTNYDNFIEDMYSGDDEEKLITYIGNEGFFNESQGWAKLYKIHGGVDEPNSIIITEDDYSHFNKNKILISAKLISALVSSPIIFMGYSLKDENVQSMIAEFASQLPQEDIRKSAQRIIVIEWEQGQNELIESQIREYDFGWNYTLIRTDNYKSVYEKLVMINQGLSPVHVRKYNQVIKKLIVEKGKKGSLDSVLLSPDELGEIEEKINAGKPIVVALGNRATIYVMPNIKSYLEDYIMERNEIAHEIALKFVAENPRNSRVPFVRHYNAVDLEKVNLSKTEKDKLRTRIQNHGKLKSCIGSINKYHQIEMGKIEEIIDSDFSKSKELDVVTYNIERLNLEEVKEYIQNIVENLLPEASPNILSNIRKLATAYDLIRYGDLLE